MGEPWFGAKTYGIGIGPKSRAGWLSILVYCSLMTAVLLTERFLHQPSWTVTIILGLLTIAFLALVFIKSDCKAWRWRWGGR